MLIHFLHACRKDTLGLVNTITAGQFETYFLGQVAGIRTMPEGHGGHHPVAPDWKRGPGVPP